MNACRKLAVNLGDSVELRVILSLLYTVTIVLRSHQDNHLRESFISELSKFKSILAHSVRLKLVSCQGTQLDIHFKDN